VLVAKIRDFVDAVRRNHGRRPAVDELADRFEHDPRRLLIERRGRLVHDQEGGPAGERPG
jgi:hypothetical protein